MDAFKNQHAKDYRIEFSPVDGGGVEPSKLVVVSGIPLQSGSAGYDPNKVNSLSRAAVDYAKRKGIPTITFESVN